MRSDRFLLLGGLAAAAATGCARAPRPAQPMNILYIMTDDHTAQMMSCYDRRYASTPNLDRIAADGVRFTQSFVANSLSGPSRACMITGKHSHANGYTDNTRRRPSPSSSRVPDTRRRSSASGTWAVFPRASTTGRSYPDRATTTTPISSSRRAIRCAWRGT